MSSAAGSGAGATGLRSGTRRRSSVTSGRSSFRSREDASMMDAGTANLAGTPDASSTNDMPELCNERNVELIYEQTDLFFAYAFSFFVKSILTFSGDFRGNVTVE
jgi:hypothetical protein